MIKIYKQTDYAKTGKLKKRAVPFYQSELKDDEDMTKTAKEIIALGLRGFKKPYFFTNIRATDKDCNSVYIYESVQVGFSELTTSPTTLFNALENVKI